MDRDLDFRRRKIQRPKAILFCQIGFVTGILFAIIVFVDSCFIFNFNFYFTSNCEIAWVSSVLIILCDLWGVKLLLLKRKNSKMIGAASLVLTGIFIWMIARHLVFSLVDFSYKTNLVLPIVFPLLYIYLATELFFNDKVDKYLNLKANIRDLKKLKGT